MISVGMVHEMVSGLSNQGSIQDGSECYHEDWISHLLWAEGGGGRYVKGVFFVSFKN